VGVGVDSNSQLGLNVAYFLNKNRAIELLATTPFSHDFTLDTVGPLGKTKHLPPTLSALYYMNIGGKNIHPYLGIGLNYTLFFDEEVTTANQNAGFSDLSLDNLLGLSTQVGVDVDINKNGPSTHLCAGLILIPMKSFLW
jgi:outer membrane protein